MMESENMPFRRICGKHLDNLSHCLSPIAGHQAPWSTGQDPVVGPFLSG